MNMADYPNCTLSEDGWLHTTGRHRPGFPRVLLSALIHLDYDRSIPIYHCRPYQAHSLNVCEVWVEIPNDSMSPWSGVIMVCEIDDDVEKMAHITLTTLYECCLTVIVDTPIVLFLIHNQEEPEWRAVMCNLTSPHFSIGWGADGQVHEVLVQPVAQHR
jgi:hypothetical protein